MLSFNLMGLLHPFLSLLTYHISCGFDLVVSVCTAKNSFLLSGVKIGSDSGKPVKLIFSGGAHIPLL